MPHFLDDDHRRFLVEHLVDGHHRAHLHQRLDDFDTLHRHLVGQVADRNGFGNLNIMNDGLGRRLERVRLVRVGIAVITLAVLAVTPLAARRATARLETTLAAFLALPRTFLVAALLVPGSRLGIGLPCVPISPLALFLGFPAGGFCCRHFCRLGGARGNRLFLGFFLQTHQFCGTLLFLENLGPPGRARNSAKRFSSSARKRCCSSPMMEARVITFFGGALAAAGCGLPALSLCFGACFPWAPAGAAALSATGAGAGAGAVSTGCATTSAATGSAATSTFSGSAVDSATDSATGSAAVSTTLSTTGACSTGASGNGAASILSSTTGAAALSSITGAASEVSGRCRSRGFCSSKHLGAKLGGGHA